MMLRAIFVNLFISVALIEIRAHTVPYKVVHTNNFTHVNLQFDENSVSFQNLNDLGLDWNHAEFDDSHRTNETCKPTWSPFQLEFRSIFHHYSFKSEIIGVISNIPVFPHENRRLKRSKNGGHRKKTHG